MKPKGRVSQDFRFLSWIIFSRAHELRFNFVLIFLEIVANKSGPLLSLTPQGQIVYRCRWHRRLIRKLRSKETVRKKMRRKVRSRIRKSRRPWEYGEEQNEEKERRWRGQSVKARIISSQERSKVRRSVRKRIGSKGKSREGRRRIRTSRGAR